MCTVRKLIVACLLIISSLLFIFGDIVQLDLKGRQNKEYREEISDLKDDLKRIKNYRSEYQDYLDDEGIKVDLKDFESDVKYVLDIAADQSISLWQTAKILRIYNGYASAVGEANVGINDLADLFELDGEERIGLLAVTIIAHVILLLILGMAILAVYKVFRNRKHAPLPYTITSSIFYFIFFAGPIALNIFAIVEEEDVRIAIPVTLIISFLCMVAAPIVWLVLGKKVKENTPLFAGAPTAVQPAYQQPDYNAQAYAQNSYTQPVQPVQQPVQPMQQPVQPDIQAGVVNNQGFCKNCGAKRESATSVFCKNCGAKYD